MSSMGDIGAQGRTFIPRQQCPPWGTLMPRVGHLFLGINVPLQTYMPRHNCPGDNGAYKTECLGDSGA